MADFADIGSDYTERWIEGVLDEHRHQSTVAKARDIEAETCNGCSYATKTAWGHKCESWKECRDDIEKRERFNKGKSE